MQRNGDHLLYDMYIIKRTFYSIYSRAYKDTLFNQNGNDLLRVMEPDKLLIVDASNNLFIKAPKYLKCYYERKDILMFYLSFFLSEKYNILSFTTHAILTNNTYSMYWNENKRERKKVFCF